MVSRNKSAAFAAKTAFHMEPLSAAATASAAAAGQVRGGGGHALRKAEGPVTRSAADGILEKVCEYSSDCLIWPDNIDIVTWSFHNQSIIE